VIGDTEAPSCMHLLRSLIRPRPMQVEVRTGVPVTLVIAGEQHPVVCITDMWLVEDECWRQPVRRQYFSLQTGDGLLYTIYYDCVADRWYALDA